MQASVKDKPIYSKLTAWASVYVKQYLSMKNTRLQCNNLKKSVCSKTISSIVLIATIGVKSAGIFVNPGACKTKNSPGTSDQGQKERI